MQIPEEMNAISKAKRLWSGASLLNQKRVYSVKVGCKYTKQSRYRIVRWQLDMSRKRNHRLNLLRSSLERPRVEHHQTTSPPVHRPLKPTVVGERWPADNTLAGGLVNGGRCTLVFIVDCGRHLCRSLLRILFYKMLQFGRKIEWLSRGRWTEILVVGWCTVAGGQRLFGCLVDVGRWIIIVVVDGRLVTGGRP